MVVRLRLARWGRKDLPFYRIVAADARAPRDGKHLEIVRRTASLYVSVVVGPTDVLLFRKSTLLC